MSGQPVSTCRRPARQAEEMNGRRRSRTHWTGPSDAVVSLNGTYSGRSKTAPDRTWAEEAEHHFAISRWITC
jgi:hypothetical protein